ncbi:MAG: hypothetical protein PHI32_02920 [Dysgonamonadaceae bacterium]|nr:hypothetical protein [Dysgonamonadaceae bacterium]MDD4729248.1 hypothetical protein [Dysgonamonadaceae bacterium]
MRKREINDLNWKKQVENNASDSKKRVLEHELPNKLKKMVIARQK